MFRLASALFAATLFACPAFAQTTNETTDVAETTAVGESEAAAAPFTITGGVTLASQYRFRGISLSDEQVAIQGTINLNHESGLYAGVWSSSTDGFGELGGSNVEVDLYAGYKTKVTSALTLDAGLLYYAYPRSKGGDFEFFEPYANLSGTLGPGTAKVGLAYAWDQDALTGNSNVYAFGDLAAAIPSTPVTLKAHLGYSKGDTPLTPSGDYLDWLVGADVAYKNLTLGVAYVDTDLTGAQAARGGATKDIVDGAGLFLLYALQRLQGVLPLNPQGFAGVEPHLAFNTAVSFVTNTNWQSYAGETTMSHMVQMLGLTVQNFLSAATGIALAFALIRGFARREAAGIGNFWADLVRVTIYLLLPACLIYALVLIAGGVPQTLAGSVQATTLEGATQTIALGPVASQEAIKMLGTNGGFFNANSAHPFENPSAWTNFVQMLSIFAIGAGLTWTFGKAVGDTRQGWAILAEMLVLFLAGVGVAYAAEAAGNPNLHALGVAGGNMEGKEVRFGIAASALFAVVTSAASCGAVNAMHDSFTAIGGAVPLLDIQLGEVVIGRVGAGLYGFLLFAILAIFVAGLMVGRSPEYVGKKIEGREVKLAVLAIAILPLVILGFTAIAATTEAGLAGPLNKGPHGFSEILHAFTSAAGNNGSAFAGLTANTPFYNGLLGVAMFLGRFFIIIPMLAIAGSLAAKRFVPEGPGSFPTTGGLWVGLLVGIILIVGGLTFLPSLVLGPGADQVAQGAGQLF